MSKLVLCTDCCWRPAHIERSFRKAQALGFVPYAAARDLDKMVELIRQRARRAGARMKKLAGASQGPKATAKERRVGAAT